MSIFDTIAVIGIVAFVAYEIYRHRTTPSVAKALAGFQKLAAKLEAAVTHHSAVAANAQAVAVSETANADQAAKALAAVQKITG